jgi:hypothetical protein
VHPQCRARGIPPAAAHRENTWEFPIRAHAASSAPPTGHSPVPAARIASTGHAFPYELGHESESLAPSPPAAAVRFLVNKASKVLNRVQDRLKLELNGWFPFVGWFVVGKLRLNRTLGDQLLVYPLGSSFFLFPFLIPLVALCYGESVLLGSCPEGDPRPRRRIGSEDFGLKQNPRAAAVTLRAGGFCFFSPCFW